MMVNHIRTLLFSTTIVLLATPAIAQDLEPSEGVESVLEETLEIEPEPLETHYGGAFRLRWVSVPAWVLDMFTQQNMPLSSYHSGFEFQRRKGKLDIVIGLSHQNMSPADGNWLARGTDPSKDVDYLQFRGLGLWSADVSFIWNVSLGSYLGFRYGGGLGLGVVTGKLLRTSAGPCTADNAGDPTVCKPMLGCPEGARCPEEILKASEGHPDRGPTAPHRMREKAIPGVLPVVSLLLGPVLTLPEVPGLELRVEAGFFNALFAGVALAYVM